MQASSEGEEREAALTRFEEELAHALDVGLPIEAGRIELLTAVSLTARGNRAVSEKTVETHLGRVYAKLDVRSRKELRVLLANSR